MAKRRVHEADVQVFKALPEGLRLQLHWEVFSPSLLQHPFFHHCRESGEEGVLALCHDAMSEISLSIHQELFRYEEQASQTYLAISGVVEYYHGKSETSQLELHLEYNNWFVEVALWLKWVHRGRVSAITPCEFIALDTARFRKIMTRQESLVSVSRKYATLYWELVVEKGPDHPADVWCDFDTTQEMVHKAFAELPDEENAKATQTDGTLRVSRSWTPPYMKATWNEFWKRLRRHGTA